MQDLELKGTVEDMVSDDHRRRFRAEYEQARIRARRLSATLADRKAGLDMGYRPACPYDLLHRQLVHMEDYLGDLRARARVEGISLSEVPDAEL